MSLVGNSRDSSRNDINNQEIGIMAVPSWDYYDDETVPEYANPWIKDVVYNVNFKKIAKQSLNLINRSSKC